tara:strand:- start:12198 stop:12443 length:246 start_codon:yes stop_codon:yes gene_type:complete
MVEKTNIESTTEKLQKRIYTNLRKEMREDHVWKTFTKYMKYISADSPSMGYDERRILAGNLTLANETSIIANVVYEGRRGR